MLIEFRLENHRSLRSEQLLSMEAARGGDPHDPCPRRMDGHAQALLPAAALYGANASGKSNVLAALRFMCEAVLESHRTWAPMRGIPREPFAWGGKNTSSRFEVTLLLDNILHRYGFVANDEAFLEEWLFNWPRGRKKLMFERRGSKIRFGEEFRGDNKTIAELTRDNSLFVATASQLNHPLVRPIPRWFNIMEFEGKPTSPTQGFREFVDEIALYEQAKQPRAPACFRLSFLAEDESPADLLVKVRDLLAKADLGIVDFRVTNETITHRGEKFEVDRVAFKHSSSVADAWLPLHLESNGTRTLFKMALPIFRSLRTGGLLLVDELEASLHPALARHIVELFNDPRTNPRNAQLLFTTHDTNLLGSTTREPALRRDQIWLTEKDAEGATVLYPLTDFKPRKNENLERGYLQGRYGAIPFLGHFSALGE